LADFFAAYYAADPRVVIAFCRKYRVSYLVVDDRHFTPEFLAGGGFFVPMDRKVTRHPGRTLAEKVDCPSFAPFNRQIAQLTQGRRHFALLSSPLFAATKLDEHLRLLDMRPWLADKPADDPSRKPDHEDTAGNS
jgi:hypothetical protein